jgi:hypothetical protein
MLLFRVWLPTNAQPDFLLLLEIVWKSVLCRMRFDVLLAVKIHALMKRCHNPADYNMNLFCAVGWKQPAIRSSL